MTKYGYERSPYGNFSTDMEVLAGYDSSSSTEEDKIQRKLASGEVVEQGICASVAVPMESELVTQAVEPCLPTEQQEEKTDQKKESPRHSSRRRSSPSSRHRNYRKRSVSESPQRSPERRSPDNSPSSRKRSRNSDLRDDRRHRRRSRSRSRSRSPRRRKRSPSPRNSANERESGRCIDEFGRDLRPETQRASSEEKDKAGTHKDEQEQSALRKKGPSERRGAHSPDRHGTQNLEKLGEERASPEGEPRPRKSPLRDSKSPKHRDSQERLSKSPDKRRRRSRSRDRGDSRSPERRRRKDYRRSPARDSRDRRPSGEYNSRRRRDRDSDRDRSRGRDNRGRDGRDRDWGRERRYDRGRDKDRDQDQERDRQDDQVSSPSHDKKVFVKASSAGLETLPRPARTLTSEEVQAKLAAHAETLRKQAQEAASVLNLPSYINPSVVNPHQYAIQQQKRKLLWSGKKTEGAESSSSSSSNNTAKSTLWNSTTFSNDQGGEMQAKFRRLMGIKGEGSTTAGQGGAQSQTNQLMENLEKEFERSRAFQLSRGAGGKSGIGLGYSGT